MELPLVVAVPKWLWARGNSFRGVRRTEEFHRKLTPGTVICPGTEIPARLCLYMLGQCIRLRIFLPCHPACLFQWFPSKICFKVWANKNCCDTKRSWSCTLSATPEEMPMAQRSLWYHEVIYTLMKTSLGMYRLKTKWRMFCFSCLVLIIRAHSAELDR